jgi:protein SCO1/2
MKLRSTLAGLAVAAMGVAALAVVTDGFRAATTDAARRLAVAARPRALPDVTLVDQTGATFRLSALQGRPVLVAFFYTNCPAICGLLAGQFQLALEAVLERPGGREIRLLSISLDTARDTVAALADYAERLGADGRAWRVARVADSTDLEALLDAFGVVVLPDGAGGFVHNAAIYRVDAEGRLVRVYDPDAADRAIADLAG